MVERNLKTIKITEDFSPFPIGRDDNDGPYNGKNFREQVLVPALNNYNEVIIDLDGPKGYGSSFLEEAFGGLVRVEGFKKQDLKKKMKLIYKDTINELYEKEAWEYIDEA